MKRGLQAKIPDFVAHGSNQIIDAIVRLFLGYYLFGLYYE